MTEANPHLTMMLTSGLILLLIGLSIATCFRKRSAILRNDLWRLVFSALVALPWLGLLPASWKLDVSPQLPPLQLTAEASSTLSLPIEELPPLKVEESAEGHAPASILTFITSQSSLLLLWALGFACILTRFLLGYLKLIALRTRCTPVSGDSPWQADLQNETASNIRLYVQTS